MVQTVIMTAQMETTSSGTPTTPGICVENSQMDEAMYHDDYVQMALFSLMKNLCADIDEW